MISPNSMITCNVHDDGWYGRRTPWRIGTSASKQCRIWHYGRALLRMTQGVAPQNLATQHFFSFIFFLIDVGN